LHQNTRKTIPGIFLPLLTGLQVFLAEEPDFQQFAKHHAAGLPNFWQGSGKTSYNHISINALQAHALQA